LSARYTSASETTKPFSGPQPSCRRRSSVSTSGRSDEWPPTDRAWPYYVGRECCRS
jgi:hypothetical protein